MSSHELSPEWTVEWATPSPTSDEYVETLVLSREQAATYGDDLVMSLRVDGGMLREHELDPAEPFMWKIEAEALVTKQISRQTFEAVADSDRDDALYAQHVLRSRAERRLTQTQ